MAAEQQLVAAVQGNPPLDWRISRDVSLPPLVSASLFQPSPASDVLGAQAPIAAVAAVGVAALVSVGIPTLPFGAFYSRIEREEAMLNRRRNDLYDFVRAEPGIHLSDLVRRSGLGWGAALYHLGVLEKNRVLVAHTEGGFKRYYANGEHGRQDMARFAALRHGSAKLLFDAVQAQPGRSGRELSQSLQLSASSLARATGRLEGAGLLRREKAGRRVLYFPAHPASPQPLIPAAA
jgi:DNA-binding transcriptional ArsR family regulator